MIDRRTFMARVGGAAAAGNVLASAACNEEAGTSASAALPAARPGLDPRALRDRINSDGEFQLRARYWDASVRLQIDDSAYDVRVQAGRIAEIAPSTGSAKADVRIAGPAQAWANGFAGRGLDIEGDQVWPRRPVSRGPLTNHRECPGGVGPACSGDDGQGSGPAI